MKKIDAAVLRETGFVAASTAVLSALMIAVFLMLGAWNFTVLFGALYGTFVAVLNFFLMGIGVQIAVGKEDPKDAQAVIRTSHSLRLLLLVLLSVGGVLIPWFHTVAALVPLLFPQIGMLIRSRFAPGDGKNKKGGA